MQNNVTFGNGRIDGELKYIASGELAEYWGAGYFLAFTMADAENDWSEFDSVKVGLRPSVSSGLVEIKTDPDKNGTAKITDPLNQVFVIQKKKGTQVEEQTYSCQGLRFMPVSVEAEG